MAQASSPASLGGVPPPLADPHPASTMPNANKRYRRHNFHLPRPVSAATTQPSANRRRLTKRCSTVLMREHHGCHASTKRRTVPPYCGRMTYRTRAVAAAIAAVRLGAGVALSASPEMFLRWEPPVAGTSMPLLLRTVGIRDLAVGVGTAAALRTPSGKDFRGWIAAGLLSDTLDVVAGMAGSRTTGIRALSSALIAAPMVVAGVYVLATAKRSET